MSASVLNYLSGYHKNLEKKNEEKKNIVSVLMFVESAIRKSMLDEIGAVDCLR